MNKIKSRDNTEYIFILILAAIAIVVFLMVKPFLITIVTSVILAYIFYPIFRRINSKVKKRSLCALATTFLVMLIIAVPLTLAMNAVAKEARINYLIIKQRMAEVEPGEGCSGNSLLCRLPSSIRSMISDPKTNYYFSSTTEKATGYIIDGISNILLSIPAMLFNLFIMFFLMFYLFRDGPRLFHKIGELSPLKKSYYERLLKRFNNVVYSIVFGYIIVALIEGTLGTIGLAVLGIRSPILLGLLMALLAIIPIVGPPLVWLPIALVMLFEGYTANTPALIIKGFILILYGILIIGTVDSILKPRIIGGRAKVHPVLILLGVLGGLKIFGFIGIIIGPVILAVFMAFLDIYEEEKGAIFK